jgi:clan AA aspartic protease
VEGRVSADGREAVIDVIMLASGTDRRNLTARAVIDTGFTGELILPGDVVRELGLEERGVVEVQLADGSHTALRAYEGRVVWDGRPRRVLAYEAPSAPLVGMALLQAKTVTIEVAPHGAVHIH